ncbi:type VI secretion system baseplate subunit TssF [Hymenobacter sp. 15J16-1T3B]|uniref:type VI secretion system baseplate subunit TssF n=1 Tax=Hymenobacter sp. 15J16-1T3B TaxID=2886941 RepID=UPI001D121214|nr:type VI secretion system baseplate subunit TssF [Hymenobacter sp. 15J16-1T3B]MCC3158599.1 type VI secretion system baseplate subunit TssF [Hymenobacter sp. 15J16-1T3B]
MSSLLPTDFSRATIKSRLTRQAAELWGYSEADLDGFDPLVQLLFEACAVELEKIGQELHQTQSRLVERLTALLNPDVVDAPQPAHAVAQAQIHESVVMLPPDAQFGYELPSVGRQAAGQEVFFSPLQAARLVRGGVRCLATDAAVWLVEAGSQKRLVAQAAHRAPAEHRRLWIGLELPAEGVDFADLTFYFDWLNEPRRAEYTAFLPGEQWLLGGAEVHPRQGLPTPQPAAEAAGGALQREYDFLPRLEQRIRELYTPYFVQLSGPAGALSTYAQRPYPAELAAIFDPATELQALTQPLTWLEVRFAHALPPEAFDQLVCALNCFPVLNRRLHKVLFRLQPALNLFPLASEEPFLAMRDVYSLGNVAYRPTTLGDLNDGATDTYTLRTQGAGRFDTRSGREALRELLDLLRDESRAFTAAGTDFIGSILLELEQNLARLEERLDRTRTPEQPVPYLLLRPQDVTDSVFLEYWSCNGEGANRLPAGSPLRIHDGNDLDSVRLLSNTSGGRARPGAEERLHALRRNLLARNRLVTLADIKAACWAEMGPHLAAVQVSKGFQSGATASVGFVRCIQVQLTPAEPSRLTAWEWQRAAQELQTVLAGQSAMHLPYEVLVKPGKVS